MHMISLQVHGKNVYLTLLNDLGLKNNIFYIFLSLLPPFKEIKFVLSISKWGHNIGLFKCCALDVLFIPYIYHTIIII